MDVLDAADIEDGLRKTPKGLRFRSGIKVVLKSVPVTSLRKWMGRAKLGMTAI